MKIVIGDGRLQLRNAPDSSYDLIVLDAFSSDSVPVHLLTREAAQLYLSKLRPGGLLAYHISSRFFDLEPVVGSVAASVGLSGLYQMHRVSPSASRLGATDSQWIVLARSPSTLEPLSSSGPWRPVRAGGTLWTDQFSNILGVVRWLH